MYKIQVPESEQGISYKVREAEPYCFLYNGFTHPGSVIYVHVSISGGNAYVLYDSGT